MQYDDLYFDGLNNLDFEEVIRVYDDYYDLLDDELGDLDDESNDSNEDEENIEN